MRAVIDTGVLVSGLIRPQGTSGEVLRALREGKLTILYSNETIVVCHHAHTFCTAGLRQPLSMGHTALPGSGVDRFCLELSLLAYRERCDNHRRSWDE